MKTIKYYLTILCIKTAKKYCKSSICLDYLEAAEGSEQLMRQMRG